MKLAESVLLNMAMSSLDVGIDRLQELLDEDAFPPDARDYEWARLVCPYTRCIHVNVWRCRTPKDRVETDIIPLLTLAKEQVSSLPIRRELGEEEKAQIGSISVNIRVREGNLAHRYLNDLDSCFPVDSIEPRLAVSE